MLGECLARVPRAPDFQIISDFEATKGTIRMTWQFSKGPPVPRPPFSDPEGMIVGLRLEAKGVVHTAAFGSHPGRPYARELSVCRNGPRGHGPCSGENPLPPLQGVVSELSVQDWYGYMPGQRVFWMFLRTPSSLLLLTANEQGVHAADRDLCVAGRWRRVLEVPVAPTSRVREEVLVGDPPAKFDCVRSDEHDARCAG